MGFITEFYYGNLSPQDKSFKSGSSAQQALEKLSRNEAVLTEKLDGELKELFLEYVKAWADLYGSAEEDSFCTGFRLGASCVLDIVQGESKNYESYLRG